MRLLGLAARIMVTFDPGHRQEVLVMRRVLVSWKGILAGGNSERLLTGMFRMAHLERHGLR